MYKVAQYNIVKYSIVLYIAMYAKYIVTCDICKLFSKCKTKITINLI